MIDATVSSSSSAADPSKPATPTPFGITPILGAIITFIVLALALNLHIRLGFLILTEQALSLVLGLALALAFIRLPVRKGPRRLGTPWYDAIAAAAALVAGVALAVRYPQLAGNFFLNRGEAFAFGIVLIPLTLEALRRTAGMSLVLIVLAFFAYGLFAHLMPGQLEGRSQSLYRMVAFLTIDTAGLFGMPLAIVTSVVVLYVMFGQLLLVSGASAWFTDVAMALMGRSRGGSAKIAIIASALFGSISGSAVSNVASTGVITIPLMKQSGFSPRAAAGFEAVASTGGQIMPPIMGAAAFLIADFLQVSYAEVVLAALFPAFLYFWAVFLHADLEAARTGIAPLSADQIPQLRRVLIDGWFFVFPFIVLVVALFGMQRTAQEAAIWAMVSILAVAPFVSYKGRRVSAADVWHSIAAAGVTSVEIIVIGAMAGLIVGILDTTGLGFALTFILVQLGEGNLLLLLLLTAVICIVLGMGMPTTAIYVLVVALAAPPLVKIGVDPMAAHLFVFYFGMLSMVTPPVAVAAFAAANLAGSAPMATALTAVRFGWPAYIVPFLFVYSPTLILKGSTIAIIFAVLTAVAGIWLATAGIVGYFVRRLTVTFRALFVIAGIALLIPANAFAGALYLEIAGLLLGAGLIAFEWPKRSTIATAITG